MAKRVSHGKTEQILEFIREFCASHGFGPTIREIGRGVGLKSKFYGLHNSTSALHDTSSKRHDSLRSDTLAS